jgi:hypothetical protein
MYTLCEVPEMAIASPDAPVQPRQGCVLDEILRGEGLNLTEAARLIPTYRGKATAGSTPFRWITEGIKLPTGQRVRLEAARIGGRWCTSAAALRRFFEAQQPARTEGEEGQGHGVA